MFYYFSLLHCWWVSWDGYLEEASRIVGTRRSKTIDDADADI